MKKINKKNTTNGGKREGAGRKKKFKTSKTLAFVIGDEALEIIEKQEDKASFVNKAIVAFGQI